MIILPRQARDKHREHSTRDVLFSYSTCDGEPFSGFTVSDDGATGKKNRFWISHLSPFVAKNDHYFNKTGSRQT